MYVLILVGLMLRSMNHECFLPNGGYGPFGDKRKPPQWPKRRHAMDAKGVHPFITVILLAVVGSCVSR
jgi:hypothetical protein